MKFLIASDIHGSLSACEALLAAYERERAARLVLLGDLLYHGPRNALPDAYRPAEVASLLNTKAGEILCVRGNCEAEVDQMLLSFPVMADYAVWQVSEHLVFATHGHLFSEENRPPFSQGGAHVQKGDVYLSGHTHIPALFADNGILYANPGSVGIPKGGSQSGYLLLEDGVFTLKTMEGATLESFSLSFLKKMP